MTEPSDNIHSADQLLEQFLHFDALGLKREARQAVLAIVDAVSSLDAKKTWVQNHLDRLPLNRASRIRHEIFEHIVFPVLKAGFDRSDPEACYLLGKYSHNLYSSRVLFEQLGGRFATDFFRTAYQHDSDSVRYRRAYLSSLIAELRFVFHEWPTGILIDHTDWHAALRELSSKLSVAVSLDEEGKYEALLTDWNEHTEQYEARLTERKDDQ